MSQHDFNIANQTFPSFRADLNDALVAAATMSAGSSAPTTPYAYQLWFDTTTDTWKVRNSGNTAWISTITTDLATGNVGIGTASPEAKLHISTGGGIVPFASTQIISESTGNNYIELNGGATSTTAVYFGDSSDQDAGGVLYNHSNDSLSLRANAASRMLIDSSGNLLVGKTAIGSNINGGEIRADGRILSAVSSNYAGYFNRRTNDGSIIQLAKDGTTVGSIGTVTDKIYIGSSAGGDTYLRLNSNTVTPANSSGADRDATINLGYSGSRFQNLFLSGTAYVDSAVGVGATPVSNSKLYVEGQSTITSSSNLAATSEAVNGYDSGTCRYVYIDVNFSTTTASSVIIETQMHGYSQQYADLVLNFYTGTGFTGFTDGATFMRDVTSSGITRSASIPSAGTVRITLDRGSSALTYPVVKVKASSLKIGGGASNPSISISFA